MDTVVMTHGVVSSTHSRINVMPGIGGMTHLNNHFSPAKNSRKPVKEYIRDCVQDTMNDIRPMWLDRVTEITIRPDSHERGMYRFTVWGTK